MPIPYEKLDFTILFHSQAAYERIDSVGKKLHSDWDIIEFEKSLFGAGGNRFFPADKEDDLKIELADLNESMPFLKFREPGQHYAYELFCPRLTLVGDLVGCLFYGHIWHDSLHTTNYQYLKKTLLRK